MSTRQDIKGSLDNALEAQRTKQQRKMARGTTRENWRAYVERMKNQKSEEYLAGDLEGYRRGYSDGRQAGEQKPRRFPFAGLFVIGLVFGAIGFAVGVGAFAL